MRGAARVSTASGSVVVDRILVAAGRRPNTEGLDLDRIGVGFDGRGWVRTNDRLRTDVASVYAAGDVTGRLPFTHAADEMGRLAAANALGKGRRGRHRTDWTPWCTFTDPEVARVGMTEAEAARHGGRVAYLPLSEVDRAVTDGRTDGYVKLIAGPPAAHPPPVRRAHPRSHDRCPAGRRDDPRTRAGHAHLDVHRAAGPDRPRLPDLVVRHTEGRRPSSSSRSRAAERPRLAGAEDRRFDIGSRDDTGRRAGCPC